MRIQACAQVESVALWRSLLLPLPVYAQRLETMIQILPHPPANPLKAKFIGVHSNSGRTPLPPSPMTPAPFTVSMHTRFTRVNLQNTSHPLRKTPQEIPRIGLCFLFLKDLGDYLFPSLLPRRR
ncbi:hypothetical protein BDN72DRAFT_533665 [Pluteus cervinus]|uniref:Uncharacterized protein n=1 Tax=Pluteus cervinus TaxID=181527 RepID=A0ACD3AXZ2_9AGAR|nr:hypothetical protein BDN72DRAFT_533665 [Pluteus cervinus]